MVLPVALVGMENSNFLERATITIRSRLVQKARPPSGGRPYLTRVHPNDLQMSPPNTQPAVVR